MVTKGGFYYEEIGVDNTTTYESIDADILPHSVPYTHPFAVICKGKDWE